MKRLLLLLVFTTSPSFAALVPRATCRADCAADIVATCTKTLHSGTTRIRPACKAKLIRRCRHHKLVCTPPTTTTTTRSGGGGQTLTLTVPPTGSDLDNGWTGISHNFPIINGSSLHYQLTCPDQVNCTGTGATGAGTPNGPTFGAPLPLLAANTPVCVVNRFQDAMLTGTFNLLAGAAGVSSPNIV